MTGISTRTIFTEWANTCGLMAECTRATGLTTEWKDEVSFPGATAESTSASIATTKNMEQALSLGLMAAVTKASGTKGNNMGKEFTLKKERNDTVSGKWANVSNGLKTKSKLITDTDYIHSEK